MVEAKNFVEKELGKSLDETQQTETVSETKEQIPIYTPPPPQPEESIPQMPEFFTQQAPIVQVVEKIIYKKQRIHGFFRTLTIIALLVIGFLMLGESTDMISLSINNFNLHQIYPLVIIFSTIIIRSYKWLLGKIFGLILFLTVFWWIFTIGIYTSLNPSTKRKEGIQRKYQLPKVEKKTNIYMETLIGNSSIVWKDITGTAIVWSWNSDRKILLTSGENNNISYLKIKEDSNRNVLQKYRSNSNLVVPNDKLFDFIYIKNLLWLHTIDLTTFKRKILKFHAGIDDISINIGNVLSGNKIEIQGAATNIQIDIPKDIWVIMYYKHLLGILDTPQFDALSWHYFQSQNLSGAKGIVNISINIWVGKTKINRVEPK